MNYKMTFGYHESVIFSADTDFDAICKAVEVAITAEVTSFTLYRADHVIAVIGC